jgi:hypothetical protein
MAVGIPFDRGGSMFRKFLAGSIALAAACSVFAGMTAAHAAGTTQSLTYQLTCKLGAKTVSTLAATAIGTPANDDVPYASRYQIDAHVETTVPNDIPEPGGLGLAVQSATVQYQAVDAKARVPFDQKWKFDESVFYEQGDAFAFAPQTFTFSAAGRVPEGQRAGEGEFYLRSITWRFIDFNTGKVTAEVCSIPRWQIPAFQYAFASVGYLQ